MFYVTITLIRCLYPFRKENYMKKIIENLIDEKVSASSEPIFRQALTGYADAVTRYSKR